jgi:glycosyltransferase involved in cell wall biosynthesis
LVFEAMRKKAEIIFTFPACMGGVASFNYNIVNYSKIKNQFYTKVIMLKALEDTRPIFVDKFEVDETILFTYSQKENQYYVQKRLSNLLGDLEGAIVTDNVLTIQTAHQFNNPKTLFHLLHDYFYVNQNINMGDLIDVAIAHSSFFSDAVFASNPELFNKRSFFIPYGVKQLKSFPLKKNNDLNLLFLGRLDKSKGVMDLWSIDRALKDIDINVNWTIIGKGILKKYLINQWQGNSNVKFEEPDTTEDVYKLLKGQDIFVFPTTFEGTPVSILECMSNGIVTITNNLPGGIRDILHSDSLGYRCTIGNLGEFVDKIKELNFDRVKLKQMQINCFNHAQEFYDIEKNADEYFKLISDYHSLHRPEKKNSILRSRIDKPFFPNFLVKFIRNL